MKQYDTIKFSSDDRGLFNQIREGDVIAFKNYTLRKVIRTSYCHFMKRNTHSITFNKLRGEGETTYNFWDLRYKIKGILKLKTKIMDEYVVRIINADTNEFIGYHVSTMGQVSKDISHAKRYSTKYMEGQLKTIQEAIDLRFSNRNAGVYPREGLQGMFDEITMRILDKHYVDVENVRLEPEYVTEEQPRPEFKFTKLDDNTEFQI